MAIKLLKGKSLILIDRTLPDIFSRGGRLNRIDAVRFCRLLKESGYDCIEINKQVVNELKRLPAHVNFLFRFDKSDDARLLLESNIKHCLIDERLSFDLDLLSFLYDNGIHVTVEVGMDRLKRLRNQIALECKSLFINSVRIVGVNSVQELDWAAGLIHGQGRRFKLPLCLCPGERLSNASAIAAAAAHKGFESLVTVISGEDNRKAGASAGEVLVELNKMAISECENDWTALSEAQSCLQYAIYPASILPGSNQALDENKSV